MDVRLDSSDMEQLIPVINKLQDVFNTVGQDQIDLPQIVVVGSQSSGKSSVIENIVTREFLPRGVEIVTRCPLVLQLVNIKNKLSQTIYHDQHGPFQSGNGAESSMESEAETEGEDVGDGGLHEWGEFLHSKGKKFWDFGDIRDEIERQTIALAGHNKGISRVPIHLKIYSAKVLNLTLVDLPGITKIPVGDQPSDIEQQIKDLIYQYTHKANSLVLAVTPANMDLVNSEALKFAREVDPHGLRTIGVLTKLDLMDAGTHALDILNSQGPYPLKLGFIGIVCRSQRAINEKKSIYAALRDEETYFKSHSVYKNIAHRCGSFYLSKMLNYILMNHIKDKLPELKIKVNAGLQDLNDRLTALGGDACFQGKVHRGSLLLRILTQFSTDFKDYIDGTSSHIFTNELHGGAKLSHIFHGVFAHTLSAHDHSGGLSLSDVRTVIRNSTGTRPSLFVPETSFELLVKQQISKLEPASLECVNLVYEELVQLLPHCKSDDLRRYPVLYDRIMHVSKSLIKEKLQPAKDMISNLIHIELAYINTNHPDFIKAGAAISSLNKFYEKRKREGHARNKERRTSSSSISDDFSNHSATFMDASLTDVTHNNVSSSSVASNPNQTLPHPQTLLSNSTSQHPSSLLTYLFRGSATSIPSNPTAGTKRAEKSHLHTAGGSAALAKNGSTIFTAPLPIHNKLSSIVKAMAPRKETGDPEESLVEEAQASSNVASLGIDSPAFMSEKEEMETHLILSLIQSYFNVVRKSISDSVPKSIMYFLVNSVKASLQNVLVTELYKEELFTDLLKEDEGLERQRAKIKLYLEAYHRAANIVADIRDTDLYSAPPLLS